MPPAIQERPSGYSAGVPGAALLLMSTALWAATAAAGPPPERASFWFELWGVPVGVVTLELHPDGRYVYRSRQVFTRGTDRGTALRERAFQVDAAGRLPTGESPESLWLYRRSPAPGCAAVQVELEDARGDACVRSRAGSTDEGTLRGKPYRARYGEDGRLSVLELGDSRFVRVPAREAASLAPPPDLLGGGLPLSPGRGPLKLVPPLSGTGSPPAAAPPLAPDWTEADARAEAERARRAAEGAGAAWCLDIARRFLQRAAARGRSAAMVQGLLAAPAEGRAYPHAWVRVRLEGGALLDLDPATGEEVAPATHLPLVLGERSGAVWLEVLGTTTARRVTRTE
jgi:hypothetical protein